MKHCATCDLWRRDGVDGICFSTPPSAGIFQKGAEYTVIWPRTNPDEGCRFHKDKEDESGLN